MKYYVNQFHMNELYSIYPNMYIGLFTECKPRGEGNFCGYYGAEYYLDTELLAYYVAEGGRYHPECRISEVFNCHIRRHKFPIGSHMWTLVIEADTFEEAFEKFENADWRRWELSDEGITVQDEIEKLNMDRYIHVVVYITTDDGTYYFEDEDIDAIGPNLLSRIIKDLSSAYDHGNYTINIRV